MTESARFEKTLRRKTLILLCYCLAVFVLVFLALLLGRYPQAGFSPLSEIWSNALLKNIILNVRFPRIILALVGGAMLGSAGFVFQMLFANPLVEPGFLGVSQGAGFGAALAIVYVGSHQWSIQIFALLFGLCALALTTLLARKFQFGGSILRLVLAGIAVSAIFSSALAFLKLVANPTKDLQDITFWMMGGLWNSTWKRTLSVLPIMVASLVVLFCFRWKLNILSLEDRTSHSVGISPVRDRMILLICATVGTTAMISVSGIISWVGLIIPHLSRRVFGSDARHALPGSMIIGAGFLLICDTFGRAATQTEIPLGLLTSLLGAIIFIAMLVQKQHGGKLS